MIIEEKFFYILKEEIFPREYNYNSNENKLKNLLSNKDKLNIYGHTCTLISNFNVVILFGAKNNLLQNYNNINHNNFIKIQNQMENIILNKENYIYNLNTNSLTTLFNKDYPNIIFPEPRIYHSEIKINESNLIVFGGLRKSK